MDHLNVFFTRCEKDLDDYYNINELVSKFIKNTSFYPVVMLIFKKYHWDTDTSTFTLHNPIEFVPEMIDYIK